MRQAPPPNQFVEALYDSDDACSKIDDGINLILNHKARQIVAAASVQAGLDAAANLATAKLLGDRAKSINTVVKKIDAFEPLTPAGLASYAGSCDPEIQDCSTHAEAAGQRVGFGSPTINLGNGSNATRVGGLGAEDGSSDGGLGSGSGGGPSRVVSQVDRPDFHHGGGLADTPPTGSGGIGSR